MTSNEGLICAYRLDGKGGGVPVDWSEISGGISDQDSIWAHLDASHEHTEPWLREHCGLNTFVIDGLLATDTRPRCEKYEDGVMLILRGVNLNPGARPEDMISIRIWIDEHMMISTRLRPLMAVQDIRDQLESGKGPVSAGHLIARLADRLGDRMSPVVEDLGEQADDMENLLIETDGKNQQDLRSVRHQLINLRRMAISLRRFIAPQREALSTLSRLDEPWLDERTQGRLRETVNQVTRIIEELDEVRERSVVVQDELMNRISQRMEKTMYALTVVATIMLPLGFLTGLLGINVGGMPGADTSWAFWAVCGMLALVTMLEVWLFKKFKWL
ncbi:MAG: zinc transporter ZntB [Rhodospirillales bacterium]|nr:zinc transporter ZntB [Rhodospirillales bacterium]